MAIQPDGKILVAGLIEGNINNTFAEDFAVARYNTDGSLDTTFGTGGEVITDFGPNSFSDASSVAVTPAGKILVAGTTSADGGDFAMAQYNADGSLDQAFGTGGKVVTNFGPNVFANARRTRRSARRSCPTARSCWRGLVLDFNSGFALDFGLASYNADGSLDPTFGTGGEVITQFGDSTRSPRWRASPSSPAPARSSWRGRSTRRRTSPRRSRWPDTTRATAASTPASAPAAR